MKTATAIACAALSALALSSCGRGMNGAKLLRPEPVQSGYDYITPRPNVELGRLYRSAFPLSRNRLPDLKPICDADYAKIRALGMLQEKYSAAPEVGALDELSKETVDNKLGVEGVRFSWLTLGAQVAPGSTTTAEFTGVTSKSMSDEDAAIVWQELGPNCKSLVRQRIKEGYGIYVPTELHKATDLVITTEVRSDVEVGVGVPIPGLKKGVIGSHNKTSTHTSKGKNMYFKLVSSEAATQCVHRLRPVDPLTVCSHSGMGVDDVPSTPSGPAGSRSCEKAGG